MITAALGAHLANNRTLLNCPGRTGHKKTATKDRTLLECLDRTGHKLQTLKTTTITAKATVSRAPKVKDHSHARSARRPAVLKLD